MLVDGLVIFLNGIPFVYSYNDTFSSVMGDSRDLCILLGNSLGSIDHNYDHICTLYSCYCTDNTVALDLFFYFSFTAKSCSINKYIILIVPGNLGINGITCSSRNVGYDHTLLTKKFVDQRRFSNVWLSYDGDLRDIVLIFLLALIWELFDHLIQHISKTLSVGCGNWDRFSDSKIIKFIYIHHVLLMAVHFVDYKAYRLATAAEHICHLGVRIHKSLADICNKNDHICRINGDLCLLSHSGKNNVAAVQLNSACIDQGKCPVKPCDICINSVTGYSWCILYYGNIITCQSVKQSGFAYIRPSHYRYYWFAHKFVSFLLVYVSED